MLAQLGMFIAMVVNFDNTAVFYKLAVAVALATLVIELGNRR